MIATPRPARCLTQAKLGRRRVRSHAASTDVKAPGTEAAGKDKIEPERLRTLEELPPLRVCVRVFAEELVHAEEIPSVGAVWEHLGERGLPFLGSVFDILREDFELAPLFEKYETDALHISLGPAGGWHVAVQSVDLMMDLSLTQTKKVYPKWAASIEDLVLSQGVSLNNEQIRPWRVATGKILSPSTTMKVQLPLMVSEFSAALRKHALSGEEVLWYNVSKRLTFSAACRAAVGDILSLKELDEMFPIAKTMGMGVFSVNYGFKEGLPFSTYWKAHQAKKQLEAMLVEKISAVLEGGSKLEGRDTVVKKVLEALEEEGVDVTSNKSDVVRRLAREVIMLMFVGTDTTSYTISRCMVWLSKNPEWLQALNEEQDRLKAEFGDALDPKAYSKCAVALAVAQETLRLTPPVKTIYRRAMTDIVVGGISVPKGTDFMLAPRKAILSTGNGKREFDPQQWLSEDRTKCTPNDDMANFVFGQGARNCIGKHLAIVETVAFLACLGREVASIDMSEKERNRVFFIIGDHPTGLPLKLTHRTV